MYNRHCIHSCISTLIISLIIASPQEAHSEIDMLMLQANSMFFRVQRCQFTLVSLEPLGDAVLQCELGCLGTRRGESARLQESISNLGLLDFVTELAIAQKHQLNRIRDMSS